MSSTSDYIDAIRDEFSDFIVHMSNYRKIRPIGKGGYANVWLARNKVTNEEVAIKELFRSLEPKQLKLFAREVRTMASVNHPFFLKFMGFSPYKGLCLLTEYIPNGSLFHFMRSESRRERLTPTHRTLIAMGIASAMVSLHKIGIIHRDLKSLNILLDKELLPRLGDFGIARFVSDKDTVTMGLGTPHWMAPETIRGEGYGRKVDVYSFGMLLYELLTNSIPWAGKEAAVVLKAIIVDDERPELPRNAPPAMRELIERCWAKNPKARPTFSQIYESFVNGEVAFEGTETVAVAWLDKRLKKWEAKIASTEGKKAAERKVKVETKKKREESSESYSSSDEETPRKKSQGHSYDGKNKKKRDESDDERRSKSHKKNLKERSYDGRHQKPKESTSSSSDDEVVYKKQKKKYSSSSSDEEEAQQKRQRSRREKSSSSSSDEAPLKRSISGRQNSKRIPKEESDPVSDVDLDFTIRDITLEELQERSRDGTIKHVQAPPLRKPEHVMKVPAPGFRDPHSLDSVPRTKATKKLPTDAKSLDGKRHVAPKFNIDGNDTPPLRNEHCVQPKTPVSPRASLAMSKSSTNYGLGAAPPLVLNRDTVRPTPMKGGTLSAIESIRNPKFRSELTRLVTNCRDAQVDELIKILSNHFRPDTPVREMDFILSQVSVLMINRAAAKAFMTNGVHNLLPFDQEELTDKCFDVVLSIFQNAPELFDQNYCVQMSDLIKRSPQKALVILAYYAQSFEIVGNAFPLLDLLFSHSKLFLRAGLGPELISIVFYLCSSFEEYRNERIDECRQLFCKGIRLDDIRTIQQCYSALCFYYDKEIELDPSSITDHLLNPETCDYALDFLVRASNIPVTEEIISTLLTLGYTDERASWVLIKLGKTLENAKLITRDNRWLLSPFPTQALTLRLFLVLFSHEKLRSVIQTWEQLPKFFIDLCNEQDPLFLAGIAVIVRKIGVTKAFFRALVSSKALKWIIETAKALDDDLSVKAALKILQTLSDVDFAPEYCLFAEKMKQVLTLENQTSALAVSVIVSLSKHPLCAKKFVDLKLESYFKALQSTKEYREDAKTFLRNISVKDYY